MTKIIEIENGITRIIERNEIAVGTLESVLPLIENRVPVVLPILPRNNVVSGVYDESDPTRKRLEILINVDPHIRLIDYSDPIYDLPPRLSFPHSLYFIEMTTNVETPRGQDWSMDQFRVFWSKTQVKSLDQIVIPALLPNIYEDGNVCFGDTGVNHRQPLADRVDQTVNEFLLTMFTAHEVREREWPWNGRSYRRWANATATHGNLAYQRIPEFEETNTNCEHYKLADLFREHPRKDQYILPDGIPGLNFTPTFMRAVEWLGQLTPTQVFRLERAIQIFREENPNGIQEPDPVDPDDDFEDDD